VFSELEKLALDYAVALSETPAEVSDGLYEKLAAQLSEAQLVELTGVIAFENFLARFNRGFAIQAMGYSEGAVCPLPDHLTARLEPRSEAG
jgi:alkylhydroperoxidase family enzyme